MLVTIDSPGFTLRVLKALQPTTLQRAHYVAPQVWAWRENRVKQYPGLWDELLCLLPFEPAFFAGHGLPARFVGHPVLESGADRGERRAVPRAPWHCAGREDSDASCPAAGRPRFPGCCRSWKQTIRLLPDPVFPLCRWPGRWRRLCGGAPRHGRCGRSWSRIRQGKHDAFAASAAALTKSGTSTLELALANVPMLVTYRVNPLSHQIAKRMIKVKYASIVNLLLDRPVVPELLQYESRPDRLAAELHGC